MKWSVDLAVEKSLLPFILKILDYNIELHINML